jgi:hypothetical protein
MGPHVAAFGSDQNLLTLNRGEIITVRGQSYVFRLPKY